MCPGFDIGRSAQKLSRLRSLLKRLGPRHTTIDNGSSPWLTLAPVMMSRSQEVKFREVHKRRPEVLKIGEILKF